MIVIIDTIYTGKYKKGKTDGTWERYKAHVLDPLSLQKAQEFKENYYQTLSRASEEYGVDLEYIVAFIGVESKFGEYTVTTAYLMPWLPWPSIKTV